MQPSRDGIPVQSNVTRHKPPVERKQEGRSGVLLGLYPKSRGLNKAFFPGLASKSEQCGTGLSAQPGCI